METTFTTLSVNTVADSVTHVRPRALGVASTMQTKIDPDALAVERWRQ